jgi:hypothetical protein
MNGLVGVSLSHHVCFVLLGKNSDALIRLTDLTSSVNSKYNGTGHQQSDLTEYDALLYGIHRPGGHISTPLVQKAQFVVDRTAQFHVVATYTNPKTNIVTESTFDLEPVRMTEQRTVYIAKGGAGGQSICRVQHRGAFVGHNRCNTFYRLQGICIQVEKDENDHWSLARRKSLVGEESNTYGCDPNKLWKPELTWVGVPAESPKECAPSSVLVPPTSTTSFDDLYFNVRSTHDPFLTAEVLTHDTLDFGLTVRESKILGSMMLVIGVFLGIQPGCTFYYAYYSGDEDYEKRSVQTPHRRPYSKFEVQHDDFSDFGLSGEDIEDMRFHEDPVNERRPAAYYRDTEGEFEMASIIQRRNADSISIDAGTV